MNDRDKKFLVTISRNPEYTGEYDENDEALLARPADDLITPCDGFAMLLKTAQTDTSVSSHNISHNVSVISMAVMMKNSQLWERAAQFLVLRGMFAKPSDN